MTPLRMVPLFMVLITCSPAGAGDGGNTVIGAADLNLKKMQESGTNVF